MTLSTEDFTEHDRCPRFRTWNAQYAPFRVSFHYALNEALQAALTANDAVIAGDKMMSLAANPGIDLDSQNLHAAAIHHLKLAELLAAYVLSVGKSQPLDPIETEWGTYQPRSFLMPDGRLRRIVMVDRWSKEREQLERFSWRTAADSAITNRPMLITALVIGSSRAGFRPSPWTVGYAHPANGAIRVQRREGSFGDSWRKLYREQTTLKSMEWLKIMQADGAFEDRVFSITEDVLSNRSEVLDQMAKMAHSMPSLDQTRSACYRFTPCPFLGCCSTNQSPPQLGWTERAEISTFSELKMVL